MDATPSEATPPQDVDISDKPCRVTEVQIKGLNQTLPDVIERELDAVREATTLTEIVVELQDVITNLTELDVFSSLDVTLGKTQRGEPGTCRLEMQVEEKSLWTLRAKSFLHGAEGGVEGRVGLRNLRGMGEKLSFLMEYGAQSLKESALEYTKPRVAGSRTNFHVKLFNYTKANYHFSTCEEQLKGLGLTLASPDRFHSLSYELGWRRLRDAQHQASLPVRQVLGHQLRSAIQYQLLHDPRPSRHLSSGYACRWISELTGLLPYPSAVQSLKNRFDLQLSWKWLPWSSLSLGAAAGVLFPLQRDFKTAETALTERFYLGGVDSVKGFHPNRIGPSAVCRPPRDGVEQKRTRDYLGGDVMASAYASLNFFPRSSVPGQLGVYARVFGDVGNVAPLSSLTSGPLNKSLRQFSQDYRASVGIGIVLPIAVGRFEVNYVLPMRYGKNDAVRPGLQMSFGTEPFTA